MNKHDLVKAMDVGFIHESITQRMRKTKYTFCDAVKLLARAQQVPYKTMLKIARRQWKKYNIEVEENRRRRYNNDPVRAERKREMLLIEFKEMYNECSSARIADITRALSYIYDMHVCEVIETLLRFARYGRCKLDFRACSYFDYRLKKERGEL